MAIRQPTIISKPWCLKIGKRGRGNVSCEHNCDETHDEQVGMRGSSLLNLCAGSQHKTIVIMVPTGCRVESLALNAKTVSVGRSRLQVL